MFCILITTSSPDDDDVAAGALVDVDVELDELLELLLLLPQPAATSASAAQASSTLVSLVIDASSWARVGCFLLVGRIDIVNLPESSEERVDEHGGVVGQRAALERPRPAGRRDGA